MNNVLKFHKISGFKQERLPKIKSYFQAFPKPYKEPDINMVQFNIEFLE